MLSAPEGPSRVARDASPWFTTQIIAKPRRGDIEFVVLWFVMSPLAGLAGPASIRQPGPDGPDYTTSPLRGCSCLRNSTPELIPLASTCIIL